MASADSQRHRFTRDEYYQMADLGFFRDHRVELIDGLVIDMASPNDIHAVAIMLTQQALQNAFPHRIVRCQLPLTLAPHSEPEPDFAIVPGSPRDYAHLGHHPTSALLVIEIADSSLSYDRTTKALLYAQAAIPEYWILNLLDRQLEVHRNPTPTGYTTTERFNLSQTVSPLAVPGASIRVADLLPISS